MTLFAAKQQWRARLLAARRDMPDSVRSAARASITAHLLTVAARPGLTVCAYVSLPTEPLAPALPEMLSQQGCRVLFPVATTGAPLDWVAPWADPVGEPWAARRDARPGSRPAFTRNAMGIEEPTGPRLGPNAIRLADVILVPALAVDAGGIRLGRGGGFYDRTLALLPPDLAEGPVLIAVIFDDEFVATLPHDEQDRRVTHAVTPTGGVERLR